MPRVSGLLVAWPRAAVYMDVRGLQYCTGAEVSGLNFELVLSVVKLVWRCLSTVRAVGDVIKPPV